MSATAGTSAFGTILQMTIASVLTNIAEVTGIHGPKLAMDTLKMTHMESPVGPNADAWQEFIGGIADGGELTFDVNFLPANVVQQAVIAKVGVRTKTAFKIIWPNVALNNVTFDALVTGFEPGAEVEGKLEASITLKLTGRPVFA